MSDTQITFPHSLTKRTFYKPTFCDLCGKLLYGLVKQGLECEGCHQTYHHRCKLDVPSNCHSHEAQNPQAIEGEPSSGLGRVRRLIKKN